MMTIATTVTVCSRVYKLLDILEARVCSDRLFMRCVHQCKDSIPVQRYETKPGE